MRLAGQVRTFDPCTPRNSDASSMPWIDAPIVRLPPALLSCTKLNRVALGTAEGALEEIVALATEKVPLLDAAPMAANLTFQLDLATADTELRAAGALLYDVAGSLWATALAGAGPTLADRARARAAALGRWSGSAAVVDTAYRAGSGRCPAGPHQVSFAVTWTGVGPLESTVNVRESNAQGADRDGGGSGDVRRHRPRRRRGRPLDPPGPVHPVDIEK